MDERMQQNTSLICDLCLNNRPTDLPAYLLNNLFFTQIIKQSINYVFSSIIHDCLPTFGQVFDPTLEEIGRFDREEVVEAILELSVVAERNSAQIVRERAEEVVIR
jgi:hypothetical protein